MKFSTRFLHHHIEALERAYGMVDTSGREDESFVGHYGWSCIREFDLILEQSGKLLRKLLAEYLSSNRKADRLKFRDLFRHAAHHDLMDTAAVERWLGYRASCDDTEEELVREFFRTNMKLLPTFIEDAKALADMIDRAKDG